ncbi:hypothetical protein HDR61_03125 [bacterium]|nr:hypothetical protein [bacterium]
MAEHNFFTLQEAINWIAFRGATMTAEQKANRSNVTDNAKNLLRRALFDGGIKAEGFLTGTDTPRPINFSDKAEIDYARNTIRINRLLVYFNVKIQIAELQREFPNNKLLSNFVSTYTTPYLEIMHEVIDEEQISATNQGNKEALIEIIDNKMKERGLPKSKNLTNAMATLIRLPESQKGKALKK